MPMSSLTMTLDRSRRGETASASGCRPVAQRIDSLHLQKRLDAPPQLAEIFEPGLGEFAQLEFGIAHRLLCVTVRAVPVVVNCYRPHAGVVMCCQMMPWPNIR